MFEIRKTNRRLGKYPCADHLNLALNYLLKEENLNVGAIEEICYALEEALRCFYYINGYTDEEEQKDFSAKLCKELKDVKRNNFYIIDFYNDNDRYELVKHLNCSCEERSEDCQKCVARHMCKLWKTKESFS